MISPKGKPLGLSRLWGNQKAEPCLGRHPFRHPNKMTRQSVIFTCLRRLILNKCSLTSKLLTQLRVCIRKVHIKRHGLLHMPRQICGVARHELLVCSPTISLMSCYIAPRVLDLFGSIEATKPKCAIRNPGVGIFRVRL